MAIPEHVEVVKRGKEAIDAWWMEHPHPSECLDLRRADLGKAHLSGARLEGARLEGAHLSGARLWNAILCDANLERAILTRALLYTADLRGARLWGADLGEANLRGADLEEANLGGSNLRGANLQRAALIGTVLDGATITNACLWETQRAGWSIKNIICEAVYWDESRKDLTQYTLGEFERLHSEKTKIKVAFPGGIEPIEIATLPALIQQVETQHPGCVLRLHSIEDAPGGAVVTLTIEDAHTYDPTETKALKTAMETTAQRVVIFQRKFFQEQKKRQEIEYELQLVYDKIIPRTAGTGRQPRTEINIGGDFQGNLIGTASSIKRNYMSEQHIHGGHFQGCSFGDHNSLTNYFGVVDNLGTVEEDIKQKLKEARKAIERANLSDADKADVVDELNKLTAELQKPEKDDGRVQRYWNRIKEVAPTVASILASAASLGKIVGAV